MAGNRWPFLGREELVRQVVSAIEDTPGGAVLEGSIGTGKTRTADTVVAALADRGWHVERCVGSVAGVGIPFGSLSHLAVKLSSKDLAYNLERLRTGVIERAGSAPLLLAIDDANLIDPSSMALFLRLVSGGDAAILVTRRSGEPGNGEAITSLWKDGHASLFQVAPLDRSSHDRLVSHVLGPAEGVIRAEALWTLSQGNPLFLRELLNIASDDGAIEDATTPPGGPTEVGHWSRLAAIIGSRARRLSDLERDALEVVAVAEPVRLELVRRLVSAATLSGLERNGMVSLQHLGDVEHVATAHPIYGATLRATLPAMRRKVVCSSLAHAMLDRGVDRPGDGMAAATWLLEAGEVPPPELAERAAGEALARGDPRLAERLAKAALEEQDRVSALVALGTARSVQHDLDGADPLFRRALHLADSDQERVDAGLAMARHEAWIEQDVGRGASVLEDLLPILTEPEARAAVGVELAALAAVGGDAERTAQMADRALREPGAAPGPTVSALVWSTLARCMLGSGKGLASDLDRGESLALAARDTVPLALDQLQITRAMWLHAVDLSAAVDVVAMGHARAVREGGMTGAWSAMELLVMRDVGDLDRAEAAARRAMHELERFDPFNNVPMVCSVAAQAAVLRGDRTGALDWFRRAGPIERMEARTRVHGDRAVAWLRPDDPATAGRLAAEAGERAELGTLLLWAAPAYHDAVRLGAPDRAVAPLARLASRIDAPLVQVMARHAAAASAGDGSSLLEVADDFGRIGAWLLSAEALTMAARCFPPDTPEAARASLAATRDLARCAGAAPPQLSGLVSPLSARETEIATEAASGRTSREIADVLIVSVRTVENHLASVYRKLGITGRAGLAPLLRSAPRQRS